MDFSSYYYYIPLNFYETPEMTLIGHEPNGDSATVLVLALAKIHTRTVTKNDDGTFTIVTDDGTFTDIEVACLLVCQSAIFIVSKGDGSGAAPWQEGRT